MDLERSLTYPFKDDEWLQKLLIAGIVGVIPIINLALIGWGIRQLKRVIDDRELPLPDWSDFGDYFVKGLMVVIGNLIYAIPMLILICLASVLGDWFTGYEYGYGNGGPNIIGVCFGCLSSLWGLLIGVVLPAAITHYAVTEDFASFFRFGEIFSYIGRNLGNYIIALIVSALVWIVASIVGGVFCGVGVILTMPWATLVTAHLLAMVYKERAIASTSDVIEAA